MRSKGARACSGLGGRGRLRATKKSGPNTGTMSTKLQKSFTRMGDRLLQRWTRHQRATSSESAANASGNSGKDRSIHAVQRMAAQLPARRAATIHRPAARGEAAPKRAKRGRPPAKAAASRKPAGGPAAAACWTARIRARSQATRDLMKSRRAGSGTPGSRPTATWPRLSSSRSKKAICEPRWSKRRVDADSMDRYVRYRYPDPV